MRELRNHWIRTEVSVLNSCYLQANFHGWSHGLVAGLLRGWQADALTGISLFVLGLVFVEECPGLVSCRYTEKLRSAPFTR